jgi:hypothetical protein
LYGEKSIILIITLKDITSLDSYALLNIQVAVFTNTTNVTNTTNYTINVE